MWLSGSVASQRIHSKLDLRERSELVPTAHRDSRDVKQVRVLLKAVNEEERNNILLREVEEDPRIGYVCDFMKRNVGPIQ